LVLELLMFIRILGSAAGGGLPQWNCNCTNCLLVRSGQESVKSRSQCSIAVSYDNCAWFLINASPDIRTQLLMLPDNKRAALRASPIQGVLLSDADLDHTLGLLSLREGGELVLHCTRSVSEQLNQGLGLSTILSQYCKLQWRAVSNTFSALRLSNGEPSGLEYMAVPLSGDGPRYHRDRSGSGNRVAWVIRDIGSGAYVIHCPCVAEFENQLCEYLQSAAAILFDGTFYTQDEMLRTGVGSFMAREMGHIPIEESVDQLSAFAAKTKLYTHMNNTNPILRADSPEREHVLRSGVAIAQDGLQIEA
jgi:pyrroloquinoline quinone biosynthesis protein B